MTTAILAQDAVEAPPLVYATLPERARAAGIDLMIAAVIVIAGDLSTLVWGFILSRGRLLDDPDLGCTLLIATFAYLLMAIGIGYWLTSHLIARCWTTPGHWWMGLRIITPPNSNRAAMRRTAVPFLLYTCAATCALIAVQFSVYGTKLPTDQYHLWQWLARGSCPGLAAILVWHGAGAWCAHRDPQHRTLSDRLAGSVVVVIPSHGRAVLRRRFPRKKLDPRTWTLVKWLPRVMASLFLCLIMLCANLGFWSMLMFFPLMTLGLIPVPLGLVLSLRLIACGRFGAATCCGVAVAFAMPLCLVSIDLWREFILSRPPFVID